MTAKEKQRLQIMDCLARGDFHNALPLAERASRQSPKNGELASYYLITLCQTGKPLDAVRYYHQKIGTVSERALLDQAVGMARMTMNLPHLTLASLRPSADTNPQLFAQLEADCRREGKLWGATEEQLLFEDRARELYLLGEFSTILQSQKEWLQLYPDSGKLRTVLASAHFQEGSFEAGLEVCRWDRVCPGVLFAQVRLLVASGRYRQAKRVARPLSRHRSRHQDELIAQLLTLLMLDRNRTILEVARRSKLPLTHPKVQMCLASACYALGQQSQAAAYFQIGQKMFEPAEISFVQGCLRARNRDLGMLRGFLAVKLMPRSLTDKARQWVTQGEHGYATDKTLRDVRKFLERHPHLLKLVPWLLRFADLPQRHLAFTFVDANPDDPWLRQRIRRFLRTRPDMPQAQHMLRSSGAVPSGVARVGPRFMAAVRVAWIPEQPLEGPAKARDLVRGLTPLMNQNRYADAEILLLRALEFAPDSAELIYHQATCMRFQNRSEEALIRFERILQRNPDHPGARLARAGYWAQQGRVREARREWREVERVGRLWLGYAAEFFLCYALILQATDPAKAAVWIEKWHSFQPNHPLRKLLGYSSGSTGRNAQ